MIFYVSGARPNHHARRITLPATSRMLAETALTVASALGVDKEFVPVLLIDLYCGALIIKSIFYYVLLVYCY